MKIYNDINSSYTKSGVKVEYELRVARRDCNHLIVVFNGYRKNGVWDFYNSIDFVKCNILFIEDILDNEKICYLGKGGNFEFSQVVDELINKVLADLSLEKSDCSLLGASKGGFAALYIGLKYNYKNIIASSFVGFIGKWMNYYKKNIANHVMGNEYTDKSIKKYDSLLSSLILADKCKDKNIYLFISKDDHYYESYGQKEIIDQLSSYNNVNLFLTTSKLVINHDYVASYFLSEILSTLTLLTRGIPLVLPNKKIGELGIVYLPKEKEQKLFQKGGEQLFETSVNNINRLFFKDNKFYLEGLAYIHNFDSPSHEYLSKKLRLYDINLSKKYDFSLGTVPTKLQTKELFSGKYVNYTAAGVATMGHDGIDLKLLPDGEYLLMISVTKSVSITDYEKVNYSGSIDQKVLIKNSEYRLYQKQGGVYLTKKEAIGHDITQAYIFELDEDPSIVDGHLFVQGKYAVIGSDMTEYNQGEYYFILHNEVTGQQVVTLLGQMRGTNIAEKFGSFSGYDTCAFATKNFEGIDLSNEDEGTYSLFVSLSYKSGIFRKKLPFKLEITKVGLLNSINSYLLIND